MSARGSAPLSGDLFRREVGVEELGYRCRRNSRHLHGGRARGAVGASDRCGRRRGRPCRAELQQLHVAVGGDEDVRRLQVAVNDAAAMRGAERIGQLHADVEQRDRPAGGRVGNHLVECASLEQLADQKRLSVVLAGVVNGADVRVRDERGEARLAVEAIDRAGSGYLLRPQQLDGDFALEPQVACAIDLASRRRGRSAGGARSGRFARDRQSTVAGAQPSCCVSAAGHTLRGREQRREVRVCSLPDREQLLVGAAAAVDVAAAGLARARCRVARAARSARTDRRRDAAGSARTADWRRRTRLSADTPRPRRYNGTRPATVPSSVGDAARSASIASSGCRRCSAIAARVDGVSSVRTNVESG